MKTSPERTGISKTTIGKTERGLIIYIDGSFDPYTGRQGWGVFVQSGYEGGRPMLRDACVNGAGSNNLSEYRALKMALTWIGEYAAGYTVNIRSDSKMLVGQMGFRWKILGGVYAGMAMACKDMLSVLRQKGHAITFQWIPREMNVTADLLSRGADATR